MYEKPTAYVRGGLMRARECPPLLVEARTASGCLEEDHVRDQVPRVVVRVERLVDTVVVHVVRALLVEEAVTALESDGETWPTDRPGG